MRLRGGLQATCWTCWLETSDCEGRVDKVTSTIPANAEASSLLQAQAAWSCIINAWALLTVPGNCLRECKMETLGNPFPSTDAAALFPSSLLYQMPADDSWICSLYCPFVPPLGQWMKQWH